jgi:hypothetical protein
MGKIPFPHAPLIDWVKTVEISVFNDTWKNKDNKTWLNMGNAHSPSIKNDGCLVIKWQLTLRLVIINFFSSYYTFILNFNDNYLIKKEEIIKIEIYRENCWIREFRLSFVIIT